MTQLYTGGNEVVPVYTTRPTGDEPDEIVSGAPVISTNGLPLIPGRVPDNAGIIPVMSLDGICALDIQLPQTKQPTHTEEPVHAK